jgi:hypothetical protein
MYRRSGGAKRRWRPNRDAAGTGPDAARDDQCDVVEVVHAQLAARVGEQTRPHHSIRVTYNPPHPKLWSSAKKGFPWRAERTMAQTRRRDEGRPAIVAARTNLLAQ